ncbi:MAG: CoB--CoM heterodisulfide reductase iron-sulfur subunit A family protein [Verrucomicrobia bacterium]|nr:CoB--CoM heterodisulfide reductase iron-sulfur subunit A family protein [Verrucomicrobiota bacterium]
MSERRIGVYICHCGGNISDYVDVKQVLEGIRKEPCVAIARTAVFTCSDATQQDIIKDIKEQNLDGLVVASCSPKLHLHTFRSVAERAGMNPYKYVHVNIREQCSWVHRDDKPSASRKAIRLVRGGIAKAGLMDPLQSFRIETIPKVLVIGAGIAGLRASLALADLGIGVYLIEKKQEPGGWVADMKSTFPNHRSGAGLIKGLVERVHAHEGITFFSGAELVEKSGSVGAFKALIRSGDEEPFSVDVGAMIVATGFDTYAVKEGEYGYGMEGVVTLPEFKAWIDTQPAGELVYNGRPIKTMAYVYCVGSRQAAQPDLEKPNKYCSRFCCSAAMHGAICASTLQPRVRQYHLFRDVRTYGKYETLYEDASRLGSVFLKFDGSAPPVVESNGNGLTVTVKDMLSAGEELEIDVDMVVLVTGMVARENKALNDVLKLPIGQDGFFNEIHPKLRPVETVIDGVFIAGTSQGPKTSSESVAAALSAVSKCAALLMKGYVELEPLVAQVNSDRCTGCAVCIESCPYSAINMIACDTGEVAYVNTSLCKGGGACVPVCPENAIDVLGYTDDQIESMIDAMAAEPLAEGAAT